MLEMFTFLLICLGFLLAGLLAGSGAIAPTFLLLAVYAGLLLALSTSIFFARLVMKNKNGGSSAATHVEPDIKEEVRIYDFHSIPESLFDTINDRIEQINPTELLLRHVYPDCARISTESARSAAHQTFSSRLLQRMYGFDITFPLLGSRELVFWLYNSRGHIWVLRVAIYQRCVELTMSASPASAHIFLNLINIPDYPIILDYPIIRDHNHFNALFANLVNTRYGAPPIASNRPPPEVLAAPAA
jgi:hypothetical protein